MKYSGYGMTSDDQTLVSFTCPLLQVAPSDHDGKDDIVSMQGK
jgi:hypothetical protein